MLFDTLIRGSTKNNNTKEDIRITDILKAREVYDKKYNLVIIDKTFGHSILEETIFKTKEMDKEDLIKYTSIVVRELDKAFPMLRIRQKDKLLSNPIFGTEEFDYYSYINQTGEKAIHLIEIGVDPWTREYTKQSLEFNGLHLNLTEETKYIEWPTHKTLAYHFKNGTGTTLKYRNENIVYKDRGKHGTEYIIKPEETFWITAEYLIECDSIFYNGTEEYIPSYLRLYRDESQGETKIQFPMVGNKYRFKTVGLSKKHEKEVNFLPLDNYKELFANGIMLDNQMHNYNESDLLKIIEKDTMIYNLVKVCYSTQKTTNTVGYVVEQYDTNTDTSVKVWLIEKDRIVDFLSKIDKKRYNSFSIETAYGNKYIECNYPEDKKFHDIILKGTVGNFLRSYWEPQLEYAYEYKIIHYLAQEFLKLPGIPKSYWKDMNSWR